jgi:hypothetical protein
MKLYGGSAKKKPTDKEAFLAETIKLTDISEILKDSPDEDAYDDETSPRKS